MGSVDRLYSGPEPFVADIVVIVDRVIVFDAKAELPGGQLPDRTENLIGRHDLVALGLRQDDLGIEKLGFGIQYIERGARTDEIFLLHAIERQGVGGNLRLGGYDRLTRGDQEIPGGDDRCPHRAGRADDLDAPLALDLLGFAHGRIDPARFIKRYADAPQYRQLVHILVVHVFEIFNGPRSAAERGPLKISNTWTTRM